MEFLLLVMLGFAAGGLVGLTGAGGAILIIPALVYLFHYSQKAAQGTTIVLFIIPVGILAGWTYYKAGVVNFKAAGMIALGFLFGSYLGAHFATHFADKTLTKVFGVFLLIAAAKMLLTK